MIFKKFLICLILSQTSNAFAFDVCDSDGFKKTDIGWIRSVKSNKDIYIEFKVSKEELEKDGALETNGIASSLARDAASNAYYKIFKSVNPPPYINSDLVYKNTESFVSTCWLKKFYGYRTLLSNFQWVESSPQSDEDMLPAVKDLLRRKQLIE